MREYLPGEPARQPIRAWSLTKLLQAQPGSGNPGARAEGPETDQWLGFFL